MLNGLDKIEGLTAEQIEAINGLGKGLVDKNADLLTKLQASKDNGTASSAELEALKQFKSNADVKTAEDAQSYTDAKQLLLDAHSAELVKSNERGDTAEAQLKVLLIDNGLSAALDGVNINKDLKAGAIAILHAAAIITEGKAMIGDKSLSDHVTEWSQTEQGKAFCNAPNNSGGDAGGGGGGSQGKSFKEWTLTEKTKLANSDPAEYQRLSQG